MRFRLIFGFILFVLLVGTVPIAMQPSTGSIEGLITDDFGPIENAAVEAVHLTGSSVAHATSDRFGHYRLEGLLRGTYNLWITAPLHDSVSIPKVFVEIGEITVKDAHLAVSRKPSSLDQSLSFQ